MHVMWHAALFFNIGSDSGDNVYSSLGLLWILMVQIVGTFACLGFLHDEVG
jgi:hypothetical protein